MDAREVDELIRQLAAERVAHARDALPIIGRVLAQAPLRWIDDPQEEERTMKLGLRESSMDRLRDLCLLVAGEDGHALDDDRMIGLLALAVVRGEPLWLSRLARAAPPPREDGAREDAAREDAARRT